MLQAYAVAAQEAFSAVQPELLIGGSFDISKVLMDHLLCDFAFHVDILMNDADLAAHDYALLAGTLRCSSGGRPNAQSDSHPYPSGGIATDVRILIHEECIETQPNVTNELAQKKLRPPNDSSAAQPADSAARSSVRHAGMAAKHDTILKPLTPLYDQFLANLEKEGGLVDLMDELAATFMFGEVANINVRGDRVDRKVPLALKVEWLLEATQAQRRLQYERLQAAGDGRTAAYDLEGFWFTDTDMKTVYNTWRQNHTSWMQSDSICVYEKLCRDKPKAAHQFAHTRFGTYLFHLFGCKMLTHKFIELPLCSAEQPAAIILDLVKEWEEFKQTERYKQSVDASTKRQAASQRLSSQIYQAQKTYNLGRALSFRILRATQQFDELDDMEKQLVEAFDSNERCLQT
jgi:hypothetical protein